VIYLNAKSVQRAEAAIEEAAKRSKGAVKAEETDVQRCMDITIAKMVLANCKVAEQDDQYENPTEDKPCTCPTCITNTHSTCPSPCACIGCLPETEDDVDFSIVKKPEITDSQSTNIKLLVFVEETGQKAKPFR
jgi:hypothetical protein